MENNQDDKISLIVSLGCRGDKDDDFIKCPGIQNNIYTLSQKDIFYQDIMNFLDKCKLFDNPYYDFNVIKNFLSIFKGKFFSPLQPKWTERKYKNYVKFCVDHKDCGLILKLSLPSKPKPQDLNQYKDKLDIGSSEENSSKEVKSNKVLILLKNKNK
jgi:hypothetical protein